MAAAAVASAGGSYALVTLTLAPVCDVLDDGYVPASLVGHRNLQDHVQEVGKGRGRRLAWVRSFDCRDCRLWISRAWSLWLRRVRRVWPSFQAVRAIERTKAGVPHLHIVVVGVPFGLSDRTEQGRRNRGVLHRHWVEVGGGWKRDTGVNVKQGPSGGSAERAVVYLTKYITKEAGRARTPETSRLRLWSRTYGFGPEVHMPGWRPPCDADGVVIERPRGVPWSELRESTRGFAPRKRPGATRLEPSVFAAEVDGQTEWVGWLTSDWSASGELGAALRNLQSAGLL